MFKREQRTRDIDDGLGPWSTGGLSTGFESGFGSRLVDRDIYTGQATAPPEELFAASSLRPDTGPSNAGGEATTEGGEIDPTRSSSAAVSDASQLKDADGDDVMTPAPDADAYADPDLDADADADAEADVDDYTAGDATGGNTHAPRHHGEP